MLWCLTSGVVPSADAAGLVIGASASRAAAGRTLHGRISIEACVHGHSILYLHHGACRISSSSHRQVSHEMRRDALVRCGVSSQLAAAGG